jgi:hypothetical protein
MLVVRILRGAAAGAVVPRRASAVPAIACAALLAAGWLAIAPRTADLAAQVYRTQLFSREGFVLWDNSWFAGHHLPGYSLLVPALGALFGPRLIAIAAVMTSATLFAHLIRDHETGRRRAIAWFACAAAGDLFIGRVTFSVGVACALACLVAVQHRRCRTALALGALTAAASPVSALLLAIVLLAWLPPMRRPWQVAIIAMPPLVAVVLAAAFPEGGTQPYELQPALVALAITAAVGVTLPREMVAARRGAALYALAIVGAYLVASPMGSNVSRLGVLAAGPMLILGVSARRSHSRLLTATATLAICAWQAWGPVTEVLKANGSQATSAAYFRPLVDELSALPPGRVEVVPTSTRWESVYVARSVALARGWETQLDRRYNALFYARRLELTTYMTWLRRLGVSYVAISDAPAERWGRNEQRLLATAQPGLRLLWRSPHWRVFAVPRTPPLVSPGRLVKLAPDLVTVALPRAGTALIRVRYTRYWRAGPGTCTSRSAHGFTRLRVPRPGLYTLRARLDVRTLLGAADRACAPGSRAQP